MSVMQRPYPIQLGRKQQASQQRFLEVWVGIGDLVPEDWIDYLLATCAAEVRATVGGKRAAYAWSGGKDSIALQLVMEQAGIGPCVMGICELEYPAFLQWVTDHMPWELDVINTGQNLDWLAENPHMLFPQSATTAARWFKQVQHTAQRRYYKRYDLDVLILGRRHGDGNYTGRDGTGIYTNNQGITRYSPIRHWTHEDVLAAAYYYQRDLPPIYHWPNGFVVGTGAWAARQWTGSVRQGWSEVYSIDPTIVQQAASYLPSAAQFLVRAGAA